jgi:hypothetical protein
VGQPVYRSMRLIIFLIRRINSKKFNYYYFKFERIYSIFLFRTRKISAYLYKKKMIVNNKYIHKYETNANKIWFDYTYVHWRPLIWKHRPNQVYWIFLIFDSVSVMSWTHVTHVIVEQRIQQTVATEIGMSKTLSKWQTIYNRNTGLI